VLNQSKTDLRSRALDSWNASLEIDPNQKDLIRLIRKYTPKEKALEL